MRFKLFEEYDDKKELRELVKHVMSLFMDIGISVEFAEFHDDGETTYRLSYMGEMNEFEKYDGEAIFTVILEKGKIKDQPIYRIFINYLIDTFSIWDIGRKQDLVRLTSIMIELKDIPDIIKELTLENFDFWRETKKFNL